MDKQEQEYARAMRATIGKSDSLSDMIHQMVPPNIRKVKATPDLPRMDAPRAELEGRANRPFDIGVILDGVKFNWKVEDSLNRVLAMLDLFHADMSEGGRAIHGGNMEKSALWQSLQNKTPEELLALGFEMQGLLSAIEVLQSMAHRVSVQSHHVIPLPEIPDWLRDDVIEGD